MCTGFACYKGRTLYAMNFDCWEVPMRMRLSRAGDVDVFWFEADMGGGYLETAAMNSKGFFGNFQGNLSHRHQNVEPGPDTITIAQLYRDSLQTCEKTADLKNMLGNRTVVYPPVPPEWNMLHNLFADKDGESLILETSDGHNEMTDIYGSYQVMTNFPVNEFRGRPLAEIAGAGDDRYRLAGEYLAECETVVVNDALDLLQKTAQNTAGWKTLCSMVFDPVGPKIYFALNQKYDDIYMVDMKGRKLVSPGNTAQPDHLSFAGLTR